VHEPPHVGRVGGEQVERDALRALRAHAGQLAELVDEVLDGALVHAALHPGQAEAAQPAGERAHRRLLQLGGVVAASRIAATTRSSRLSTSSGSTARGSIFTETTSPEPVTTAVTSPPPAVPVTSVSASLLCASMSCCCIFCACFISCCMLGCPPGPAMVPAF
jgi:hypothetical protein